MRRTLKGALTVAGGSAARRLGGSAAWVAIVPALLPLHALAAQDSFPKRPPAPTALRPAQFPAYQEVRLPSGATLLLVEHHEQPTVSVSLSFRAGSRYDPAGKEGLAELVAEVLSKGTPTRTAEQIAATIEGAGGSLGASAGMDFLTISSSVLTDHLDLAFELLSDVTRRAAFPAVEVELARTRYLSQLQVDLSTPEGVAERHFARELYGTHPYGRRVTPVSYRAITRDDISRFASQRFMPRGALLVVAGDVTMARARSLVDKYFAGWQGAPPEETAPAAPPRKGKTDILLVHRPGSVQANILAGNTTIVPTDTNYYAARVATQVLGGGADARLFMILREEKGWTYGAYARLNRYRGLGYFEASAETRTAVADSALRELLRQVDRIRTEAVPDSELTNVRGFLVGSYPLTIETPGQIAGLVANVRLLGLPDTYLRTYRDRLAAVTATRVRQAATRLFRRDSLVIVVVGDAVQLRERLAAIAPVRMVDLDGKALTAADLAPKAPAAVVLDRTHLVSRSDSFNVMVQGQVFGAMVTNAVVTPDSVIYRERTAIAAAGMAQETTVQLDARSLAVTQVDQTGTAGGQKGEIHLTYAAGRVKGTSVTPQPSGTPRSLTVDTTVAAGTYDDNAVQMILPALPLEAGKTLTLGVFSSGDGTAKVLTLKIGTPEQVTVPAGAFEAFPIEIAGGQAPLVMYVTTAAPRRVVKVQITGAPFSFELAK